MVQTEGSEAHGPLDTGPPSPITLKTSRPCFHVAAVTRCARIPRAGTRRNGQMLAPRLLQLVDKRFPGPGPPEGRGAAAEGRRNSMLQPMHLVLCGAGEVSLMRPKWV